MVTSWEWQFFESIPLALLDIVTVHPTEVVFVVDLSAYCYDYLL